MVAGRPYLLAIGAQGIVGLTAPQGGEILARAESDGLHSGDGEHVAGDLTLHRVGPVRAAQSRRKPGDGAGHLSAHAVALFLRLGGTAAQVFLVHHVGRHGDALTGQHRFGDAACRHQRRGEPSGEVPAAPVVLKALGFDPGGVVRVAGPGHRPQRLVVLRPGIPVGQRHHQRHAGGAALKHAGEELYLVRLLPCRGQCAAGAAAQQVALHLQLVYGDAGRDMPQQHPHHRAV